MSEPIEFEKQPGLKFKTLGKITNPFPRIVWNLYLKLVKENRKITTTWNLLELEITNHHFTHEPRAVTMKLCQPKRKCLEAVPTHLQNHVVWSRTHQCSVKSYAITPSTKCYSNEILFMRVLTHHEIE
jgi:hypothetical protein